MKKYVGICGLFGGSDICVFADTVEEARKIARGHFISLVEKQLTVCEAKARTERCDICQYTYIPSEIIDTDGERLCRYCYDDKYGFGALTPDDIPF
jgi:hypothetical protein